MEKSSKTSNKNLAGHPELLHVFNRMSSGFSLQEIILNKVGEPADFRFLAMNKAYEKMWGLKASAVTGKTGKEIHAKYDKTLLQTFARVALTGRTARTEYYRQDLQRYFKLEIFSPEKGIFATIINDITERREIEKGLEKNRKELAVTKISEDETRDFSESIINTIREPLIALDQDLRVVSVSRSFYEVFKVKPAETVGQLIYDLGNKQWDIPRLRELLETILPQKASFDDYEVEHDFATIGRRIMLLNARQIERVLGKERIILLAIEDITERKKAEEKLARAMENTLQLSEERYRKIFENAQIGIYRTTPDGKILDANPALISMLGYSNLQDLSQRNLEKEGFELKYPRNYFKELMEKNNGIRNFEAEWTRNDGSVIFVTENTKAIRGMDGKILYYEGTVEDITERKKTEEEIRRRAEELRKRNDDLERFNKAAVGRELRMIELKKQINEFSKKLGQSAPYPGAEVADTISPEK